MTARIVNKPNTLPDVVNMRAEYRLWGRICTTDRTEPKGSRRVVAIGGLRGPGHRSARETRSDGSAWLQAYHDEQGTPIRWVF